LVRVDGRNVGRIGGISTNLWGITLLGISLGLIIALLAVVLSIPALLLLGRILTPSPAIITLS